MSVWKPVPGWVYYEVSSDGEVRSLDHWTTPGQGRRFVMGRTLKQKLRENGYLSIRLSQQKNGVREFLVHRLVLEAFIGPCPEGMEARHLNGDRADNRAENLAWGTKVENAQDMLAHGNHWNARKETCPQGHQYSRVDPKSGKRLCQKCRTEAKRRERQRRKAP